MVYFAAIVVSFGDDCLFASEPAGSDNDDSACFESTSNNAYILPIGWLQILIIILNFNIAIILIRKMHFSKSDRTLHSKNYNPPCNVYQPDELINSKKALLENMYQGG